MKNATRLSLYAGIAAGALILSAIVTQCYAETVTTNCKRNFYTGTSCTTTTIPEVPPTAPAVVRAELEKREAERVEREAKWESFCKPVVVFGEDGIGRYRYAHKNCDLGRAQ